ncbi:hypothetical protein LWI28_015806 [Acer negundo]|uniref:Uncharacterized protein n=1 Tax=Acer negundo TaxID=4023 RepID=A0AAD5IV21_ACENE|nr:hypothetical protein LWI28_015806 [Acer negundo]
MWDLKPMILARKQAGQPISPSLEEEFNNLPQSLQQAWDEAATFPSYHKIVERELDEVLDWVQDVFGDSEEDEEEETEEKVKEVEDVPFEEPLLYKELKPYVPPITLPSQPEQENVVTFPLKGEEVEKEDTEEKVKEAEDVPFEAPLIYKELKPYVYPITLLSQPKQEDVVTFPLKGEEVEKEEMEEQGKEAEDDQVSGTVIAKGPKCGRLFPLTLQPANASPSVMYPAVILPTAPLVSSSPSSISLTANVGISLRSSRPTDTTHLTPAKSRTSLPAKLFTLPMARSPLSEMAARASRVRSIPGQIQRQAPATSSMKPVDHSLVSPPPHLPRPRPIVPSRSQLRVDKAKETGADMLLEEHIDGTGKMQIREDEEKKKIRRDEEDEMQV